LFPLHSWHCYVQIESNTARWQLCARGIGGKQLIEGNGQDTRGIVSDFVKALNEANEVKMAWMSGCLWIVLKLTLQKKCHSFLELTLGILGIISGDTCIESEIIVSFLPHFRCQFDMDIISIEDDMVRPALIKSRGSKSVGMKTRHVYRAVYVTWPLHRREH
jgi:hypothetical protein